MKRARTLLGLAGGLLLSAAAAADERMPAAPAIVTVTQQLLSERLMVEAAQAAIDFCAAHQWHAHVVIVDGNGVTRLLLVGDGSRADTVDGARRKAYTAALMGEATATLAQRLSANPKMLVPPDAQLLFLPGGIPIRVGTDVIGAIAVGGGAPEQDAQCAQAGLERIQAALH